MQTVDTVFVRHALPKGEMMHRDRPVDLAAIRRVALLTIEGEHDDISGVGQTEAAHGCASTFRPSGRRIAAARGVGHYGVFNGSRFRAEIAPRIADLSVDEQAAHGRAIVPTGETPRAKVKA